MLKWEWYSDPITKSVFLDLLLSANRELTRFRGFEIKAGQTIFGRKECAIRLGITEQNVRTAINHLKSTNELTIKLTNRFSIITIVKWEQYQSRNSKQTNQQTNQQLTNNQPTTNHTQEVKNIRSKEDVVTVMNNNESSNCKENDFEKFWKEYPNKKAKPKALISWKKLKQQEKEAIFIALPKHKNSDQWQKDNGSFIPHPATWINQRRWEDNLEISIGKKEFGEEYCLLSATEKQIMDKKIDNYFKTFAEMPSIKQIGHWIKTEIKNSPK